MLKLQDITFTIESRAAELLKFSPGTGSLAESAEQRGAMIRPGGCVVVLGLWSAVVMGITSASGQLAGSWSIKAAAPTKRTEVAVASLGTKIYIIGGFGRLGVTALVEEYDTSKNLWRKLTPLPKSLHHAGIGAVNGRLYVIGGFTGNLSWTPSDTVFEYDPNSDRWTTKKAMPTARGALAVGVYQGNLYAIGGYADGQNSSVNEKYNPVSDRWEPKAPMPTARDHLAAAVVEDILYAVGGRLKSSYANNLAVHEAYDFKQDRWTRKAPMPTPRSGIAAGVLDNKIFILGGEAPEGTFNLNEVYDPKTDRWQAMAPMPTARHGLGAARVGNHLYVISGGPRPGGSFSDVNEVFSLSPPEP